MEGIKIDQRGYIKQILKDHGLHEANGCTAPLPRTVDVHPARENELVLDDQERKKYRSIIESLLYMAVCIRPELLFIVSVQSRRVHAPTSRHLALTKQLLHYIARTVDVGQLYTLSLPVSLIIWSHQLTPIRGYKVTLMSTSGWFIAINVTPITCRGHKQSVVAL